MLHVKGDLEIWFSALLIASFPKPLQVGLLYLCSWWCSFSYEKDSLGGVLDLRWQILLFSLSEEESDWEGVCFRRAWRNSFFRWSIFLCMALLSYSWEMWLPTLEWLLLVWVLCTLPSWSHLCSRLRKSSCHWKPMDSCWWEPDPTIGDHCTCCYTSSPHRWCQL